MVPDLMTYIDMTKAVDKQQFLMTAEEWDRSQPDKRHWYKHSGGYRQGYQYSEGNRSGQTQGSFNPTGRKPLTCFSCGKVGHQSRDCRFKQVDVYKPE